MKWFKNRVQDGEGTHPIIERTLLVLNGRLRRTAAFLQKKTARYSPRKMKTLLAFFCLCFLAGSVAITINSFYGKEAAFPAVTSLRFIPLLKDGPRPLPVQPKAFERVHRFKRYLDSLGFTEKGQAKRDSLLQNRPGLMDTLSYLESLYTNENKNEAYGKEERKN